MNGPRNADTKIDAFLAEGATDLPDRAFDAVRSDIHRTRQRVVLGPWREPNVLTPIRLALAAAIVVVAAGVAWSQIGARPPDAGTQPSPVPTAVQTAAPTASATQPATLLTGTNAPLVPGRYRIDYGSVPGSDGSGPSIEFEVSASGWHDVTDASVDYVYLDAVSYGPSFGVWNITAVAGDPCASYEAATPAPGPGIDELLDARSAQAGITAGPLTPVTVDGYAGKYVELTVDRDITTCPEGFFTWGSPSEGRAAKGNGEVDRVYAVDVDGRRITFFTRVLPDTYLEHEAQARRIVDSIDIRP
jgi:hypothetical protein